MREIKFEIKKEVQVIPESILFHTVFHFSTEKAVAESLENADASLVAFLNESGIPILRRFNGKVGLSAEEDLNYICPMNEIELTPITYKLVEKYRDNNPALHLSDITANFSRESKQNLVNEIRYEASEKARKIADAKRLRLKPDFEMKEIIPKPETWRIYPPSSARYDQFRQTLSAYYAFVFYAL